MKALAVAEIGLATALLTPVVPNRLAGAALSAFSGGLLRMYLRTPTLRGSRAMGPGDVPNPHILGGRARRMDQADASREESCG